MLDQLVNSLKSEIGGQIAGQSNLQSGHIDQIFSILGNVAQKEVGGHMAQGNLGDVMNLFTKTPNSAGANKLQSNISSGAISEITKKLGISPAVASSIVASALPGLISKITNHNSSTPDDDPSPLKELFGGSDGLGGIAKNLLGSFLK
jgi:uncharacterized protein YidB (DUF937 family)